MDGVADGGFHGFAHSFAESGVGVDGGFDVFPSGFESDGESEFGDHFGGIGADDMGAENFAVRFTDEDFDEAFAFADGAGFSASHEGEFSDFKFPSFFFGGPFGQADAGDLRMAVGATWENRDFFRFEVGDEHAFDRLKRFIASDMGEPWWPDDITGGKDSWDSGLVAIVGLEITAIGQPEF